MLSCRLRNWIVTRMLPSIRHEWSGQLAQSLLNRDPWTEFHLPAGQSSHSVAEKASLQVPAGHETQESTPAKALYFDGGQGKQTLALAMPTAG